jgi:hypothetical protein
MNKEFLFKLLDLLKIMPEFSTTGSSSMTRRESKKTISQEL